MDRVRELWTGVVISRCLGGGSLVHDGDSVGDLLLETEVGSFIIPPVNGGGDSIHTLDTLHDPCWDPSLEIQDESGSVLDFVILGVDDVGFKPVDIILELLSIVDAGGGQPVHGFLGSVSITKCLLKICFKGGKSPEGLVGETLLAADLSPCGSGSFLHI